MHSHADRASSSRLVNRGAVVSLLALSLAAPALAQQPSSPASTSASTPAASNAAASSARPSLFAEPAILSKGIARIERFDFGDSAEGKDGFYPELGYMITGSGWISAGGGYRQHLFDKRAVVDTSAAISWRAYKVAQARFELPSLANDRLTVGTKLLWQDFTQVRYFGGGPDSVESGVSDYRIKATDLVGYAGWRLRPNLEVSGAVGRLGSPAVSTSGGPFERDEPDTITVYASDPAAALVEQPVFLHADGAVTFDSRDHKNYPTAGSVLRAGMSRYRDRTYDTYSFNRFEFEAAHFIPVVQDRGVVALHWWAVLSDTGDDQSVPFYLLPSLGGHNTLRGYADYRFHDRHFMVINAESRWALFPHLDGAVFFDAGNVAARVADLDFGRTSAGFGFRLHTDRTTLARLDIGHGDEGWRVILKLTDPLHLGRLSRRTAAVPFVP
jgi:surface antigen Omp85-like protein